MEFKGHQTPPKQMAQRLVRVLRPERPEYAYLTKVFRHTRALLAVKPAARGKRLPHLLTDRDLVAFYEAVWRARHPTHMVMIKMLIFTGLRNSELARVRLQDVDLDRCQIRVVQGKGSRDRAELFPTSFRGELLQYMQGAPARRAVHLFESNRLRPYSTRRIRQIVHAYAPAAGIQKRVYPLPTPDHHVFDQERPHQPQAAVTQRPCRGKEFGHLSGLGIGRCRS